MANRRNGRKSSQPHPDTKGARGGAGGGGGPHSLLLQLRNYSCDMTFEAYRNRSFLTVQAKRTADRRRRRRGDTGDGDVRVHEANLASLMVFANSSLGASSSLGGGRRRPVCTVSGSLWETGDDCSPGHSGYDAVTGLESSLDSCTKLHTFIF